MKAPLTELQGDRVTAWAMDLGLNVEIEGNWIIINGLIMRSYHAAVAYLLAADINESFRTNGGLE